MGGMGMDRERSPLEESRTPLVDGTAGEPTPGHAQRRQSSPKLRPGAAPSLRLIVWGALLLVFSLFLAPLTSLWWLVLVFGLLVPVLSTFRHAAISRAEVGRGESAPEDDTATKQRRLLDALARGGALGPAAVAVRAGLTVSDATSMLDELARQGHVGVTVQGDSKVYALPERDRLEILQGGEAQPAAGHEVAPPLHAPRREPHPVPSDGDARTAPPHPIPDTPAIAEDAPSEPLTERELEVLGLLASGWTYAEVAQHLIVAPGTVKAHTNSIYRKLSARNRTEALQQARRMGLLG